MRDSMVNEQEGLIDPFLIELFDWFLTKCPPHSTEDTGFPPTFLLLTLFFTHTKFKKEFKCPFHPTSQPFPALKTS